MSRVVLSKGEGKESLLCSRFEAEALPFSDPSSFPELLFEFKRRHPKADHYPYAYRVGESEKSSDDGEPSGSAGKPLLTLLQEEGAQRCLILVARYFGGTKLGVGRLRRCFLSAGKEAYGNCRLGQEKEFLVLELSLSYSRFEELKRLCRKKGFLLQEEEFSFSVKAKLAIDATIPFREEDLFLKEEEILSRSQQIQVVEVRNDPVQ